MIPEFEPVRSDESVRDLPVDIDVRPHPNGLWTMDVKLGDERRMIPVFNCREDSHKRDIAQYLASYKVAVAFGVGLYGVSALVEDSRKGEHPESWKIFYDAKLGRSIYSRVPIFIAPKNMYRVMDQDKIHPEFRRFFQTREARETLYRNAVTCHLILPIPDDAPYIHWVFKTTEDDWKKSGKPQDQWLKETTVSAFWWHDPDWEEIADLVEMYEPDALTGISSFNEHGELPVFNLNEAVDFVFKKKRCPFDFVVGDPKGEEVGVKSSLPQFRPAFVGEKPEWVVYRDGARSIEGFLKAINSPFGYRRLESATLADRGHPKETVLDDLVLAVDKNTLEDYTQRHPPKGFLRSLGDQFVLRDRHKSVLEGVEGIESPVRN